MLPKVNRLPSFQIRSVMRSRTRIANDQIQLIYKDGQTACRFAFIVSTKIDKRASHRNRIRRILSESTRHLLPLFNRPIDGIFMVKKSLADKESEFRVMISKLLTRAGLLRQT